MTSSNNNVSHQKSLIGNIAKSVTSEGNSAMLPANVDWRLLLFYNALGNIEIIGKQNCFPPDQSLKGHRQPGSVQCEPLLLLFFFFYVAQHIQSNHVLVTVPSVLITVICKNSVAAHSSLNLSVDTVLHLSC